MLMERKKINNKIELQRALEILWTKQRSAKAALGLLCGSPTPQFWRALLQATREVSTELPPLKQSLQVYCRVKLFVSINRQLTFVQQSQATFTKGEAQKKKRLFSESMKAPTKSFPQLEELAARQLQWQASPGAHWLLGIWCSFFPLRDFTHVGPGNSDWSAFCRLPALSRGPYWKGACVSHPEQESFNPKCSFTPSPQHFTGQKNKACRLCVSLESRELSNN